ncbi:MAG: ribosome maturation factor RimP [Acidobacteria bacterium]|nr:ribosome maturation factor RimP [Acidobacteriota bacterium]
MADLATPIAALLAEMDLSLYDLEFAGGTLSVTVTRPGGIDLDAVAAANIAISQWLDEADPIAGRFTLDVSSPGLERRLRTREHFVLAIGETITLRERRTGEATRRLEGELISVSETTASIRDRELGEVEVVLDNVERARTVFSWGATAKPSPSKGRVSAPAQGRKAP